MHPPGIEPGAGAWKAPMLPLHQGCKSFSGDGIEPPTNGDLQRTLMKELN